MHIRHERCRRHVSQKVMIAIVSFGLMLSSCTTLHKTPTPSPFETAYKTYITTFDAWDKNLLNHKDYVTLRINTDDFFKAKDNLINVAKEAKPYASDALKNAIDDTLERSLIRTLASKDDYDKMIDALANAYKSVLIDDRNYLSAVEAYSKAVEISRNAPIPDKDATNDPSSDVRKEATKNLLKAAARNVQKCKTYGYFVYYYFDTYLESEKAVYYYDSYLRDAIILVGKIFESANRANSIAFKKAVEDAVKVFEAAKPVKQVSSIP
ncbi:hypothetical protein AGMMS49936_10820 [Endomicrobiia bacterium]|nr:hypothetical protein AGMMS49936_10820 [Endomicrobiia bacterium]